MHKPRFFSTRTNYDEYRSSAIYDSFNKLISRTRLCILNSHKYETVRKEMLLINNGNSLSLSNIKNNKIGLFSLKYTDINKLTSGNIIYTNDIIGSSRYYLLLSEETHEKIDLGIVSFFVVNEIFINHNSIRTGTDLEFFDTTPGIPYQYSCDKVESIEPTNVKLLDSVASENTSENYWTRILKQFKK